MIRSRSGGTVGEDRSYGERQPFLSSHRAIGACTREFARLSEEVASRVAALRGATGDDHAAVRQSPVRCIVQLGPVALTVGWLRHGQDSVETGELLVIVWRGAVAPQRTHEPERPAKGPARLGATPVSEHVFTAVGDSEASWGWQERSGSACWSSSELAAQCVDRLRTAYTDCRDSA